MLDIIQTTKSIIISKLKLFTFVYLKAIFLFILTTVILLVSAPKPLSKYFFGQIQNISELEIVSNIYYLLIWLFLALLNFVYLEIANIYVSIIKQEHYRLKQQLKFVLKNTMKVTFLRTILILLCLIICGTLFSTINMFTKSFLISITAPFLLSYFYFTPVFFVAEIELLVNNSSLIDSIKEGFTFVKNYFTDCAKIFSLILMLQMLINLAANSVIYIILYCLVSIFTTVLVTVFYLKYKNNSLDTKI